METGDTEMKAPHIKIDTVVAHEKRYWPVTRFVAAVDGVWLVRKDGGIRKFKTRGAALNAAAEAAAKVTVA
jgi:hypothetical protein